MLDGLSIKSHEGAQRSLNDRSPGCDNDMELFCRQELANSSLLPSSVTVHIAQPFGGKAGERL